jgi:hypothetical protein
VFLHGRTADRLRHGHRTVRRKRDAVEARCDRVRVGHAAVHARRTRAAEQHLAVGQSPTRLEKDAANVLRARNRERARLRIDRHDDDEHQRMDSMPRNDVERPRLADDAPIMEADDDVRHDLHRRRAKRREGRLEILDRAVEVIDVADRLVGADDVHHRRVDTGGLHALRARLVEERRMDRDLEIRIVALQPLEHRVVALVLDLVALRRAAREQEAAQVLRGDQLTDLAVEHVGRGCRNHRLQDLRLAVVAIERAAAGGDRERRECVLAAAFELAARVRLECRRREADRAADRGGLRALAFGEDGSVEGRILEDVDRREGIEPAHRAVSSSWSAARFPAAIGFASSSPERSATSTMRPRRRSHKVRTSARAGVSSG